MFSSHEALCRVSHELRTPLNAILGFGQLLALDELSESQRHGVEQIIAGGRHLLALVEDLLDLSRLAGDNLGLSEELVDVAAEIAAAAALCGPLAAERGLSLSVETPEGPLWTMADGRRLKQVLLNLISNAIKYNRTGGAVTLRAVADGEERITIEVIDTGVGMTSDQLGRLFRPFERLDAPRRGIEGHGLGLAVTKGLVEAMGGSIDVVSSAGAGTVVTVGLRAAAGHGGVDAVAATDGAGDAVAATDGAGDAVAATDGAGDAVAATDGAGDAVAATDGAGDAVAGTDGAGGRAYDALPAAA